MNDREQAKLVLERVSSLIIPDLKTCVKWASEYHVSPKPGYGGLNFTLCILSLVACETFGFYTTGAQKHKQADQDKQADTGSYIKQFVQKYFASGSYLKKMPSVLASLLRNSLVHGFGQSRIKDEPVFIEVFIDSDIEREIITDWRGCRKVIRVNALAMADRTVSAVLKLCEEVDKGTDLILCANIVAADEYKFDTTKAVVNEFNRVYGQAE